MNTQIIYLIFVRPTGSTTWTQHMKKSGIPWRTSNPMTADKHAVKLANSTKYCIKVVSVEVPSDPDGVYSMRYSMLSNGDTLYAACQ